MFIYGHGAGVCNLSQMRLLMSNHVCRLVIYDRSASGCRLSRLCRRSCMRPLSRCCHALLVADYELLNLVLRLQSTKKSHIVHNGNSRNNIKTHNCNCLLHDWTVVTLPFEKIYWKHLSFFSDISRLLQHVIMGYGLRKTENLRLKIVVELTKTYRIGSQTT